MSDYAFNRACEMVNDRLDAIESNDLGVCSIVAVYGNGLQRLC